MNIYNSLKSNQERLFSVGRIIVSLAGFIYLYSILPVERIVDVIPSVLTPVLILTVGIVMIRFFLTTYALRLVTHCYHRLSYLSVFHIDVLVWVSNSFLPSSAASLAATPIVLDRYTPISKLEGLTIKMIDYSLLGIAVGSVVLAGTLYLHATIGLKYFILVGCLLSSGIYLAIPSITLMGSRFEISRLPVVGDRLPEVTWPTDSLQTNLLPALGILFVAHVILIGVRFATVATATGISVPTAYLFLIPVLGYSVTVLPISISGAGVAETVSIALLLMFGVDPELAAVTVFIDRVIGVYLPVVVLYVYVVTGHPTRYLSKDTHS